MILCDIGNTSVDIYQDGVITKFLVDAFKPDDYDGNIFYTSVNHAVNGYLAKLPNWHNIEKMVSRENYYDTMGLDRILVCEAVDDGIIIDAGSAITVDVMRKGKYEGGFIALGLRSASDAYERLSPALATPFNFEVDLTIMAKNTPDAITLGYLAPLIYRIRSLEGPKYVTGGDARILARMLEEAIVDEALIFKGMKKLIDKGYGC